MDVEATMQFILESQRRAEARADRADARADKADARMDRAEARANAMEKRFDKRIDSIGRLLQQGMRILVRIDARVEELAVSQKETDRELKALLKRFRSGRNGRNGH